MGERGKGTDADADDGTELNISCCPFLRPFSSCVDDRERGRIVSSDDVAGIASSGINSRHCRHETAAAAAAREIITNRTVNTARA